MTAVTTTPRPEYEIQVPVARSPTIERELSLFERMRDMTAVRRALVLVAIAVLWEGYARYLGNPLMFPTFSATMAALWDSAVSLAVSTRTGTDVLATMTAMFNPLPAIALLPLAIVWFGLGVPSLVFVIVHSVLWAVAVNTHSDFLSYPRRSGWLAETAGCAAGASC